MKISLNNIMLYILLALGFSVSVSSMLAYETYQYTGVDGGSHDIGVYYPENWTDDDTNSYPCAVFFHGGSWRSGSLHQFRNICEYLAQRGMVSITANYSMLTGAEIAALPCGESRKRICVIDGKSVIRWVKKNADTLNINPGKIVAGGASAGGHIAVLSALEKNYNNPNDDLTISTEVQAFLLFTPAFTELCDDSAPVVNAFNLVGYADFPTAIMFAGGQDRWEPASAELRDQLRNEGTAVVYYRKRAEGHMFWSSSEEWLDWSLERVDHFLVNKGYIDP